MKSIPVIKTCGDRTHLVGVYEDDFVNVERKQDVKEENFVAGVINRT
jgi:hypothetical protein